MTMDETVLLGRIFNDVLRNAGDLYGWIELVFVENGFHGEMVRHRPYGVARFGWTFKQFLIPQHP